MAEWIIMPKQGLQMTEGIITQWFRKEGEAVTEGADLFEMETDKLNISIPASVSGTLLKIIRKEGDTVPITEPIAIVGASGEDISALLEGLQEAGAVDEGVATEESEEESVLDSGAKVISEVIDEGKKYATPRAKMTAEKLGVPYTLVAGTGPEGLVIERDILAYTPEEAVKATPLARKVAAGNQVDLQEVQGTGSHGKVTTADIYGAMQARKAGGGSRGEKIVPFTGMRRAVATRMKQSLDEMAQANHRITVDATAMVRVREALKRADIKVSYNDIILRCVAKALTEFPTMNASWSDEGIVQKEYVNLGVAVAISEGLIVPVIKDADLMNVQEIATCAIELATKAKENQLSPDEYKGGTFTVSNLGMFDIDSFTPIVNPPEAGILGVGKLCKQPVVVDDEIVIRPQMQLSLSYDHRIVDGAPAAMFLHRVKVLLENPELLL